jgi:hypothetical protein
MAPCRCPVRVDPNAAAAGSPALDHGPLLSKPCGPRRGEPEVNAGLRPTHRSRPQLERGGIGMFIMSDWISPGAGRHLRGR